MVTAQELAEKLLALEQQLRRDGITLWGGRDSLSAIAEALGGVVLEIERKRGCTNESCGHFSHDPAAATFKWIPPERVKLVHLGDDMDSDGDITEWYAVFDGGDDGTGTVYFLKTWVSRFYHGSARIVDVRDIPEWALLELSRHVAETG